MIARWIDRNPEYARQVRAHEAPYPWFFNVWQYLFIVSIPSVVYLIYYILKEVF